MYWASSLKTSFGEGFSDLHEMARFERFRSRVAASIPGLV
jgi:hypothetical protein